VPELQEELSGEREPHELDVLELSPNVDLVVDDPREAQVRSVHDTRDLPARRQAILLPEVRDAIPALPEVRGVRQPESRYWQKEGEVPALSKAYLSLNGISASVTE
jgi:hypothetical protein